MKKSILVILVALVALPAFSQIKFGIKAGAETTQVPTYSTLSGGANATIDALESAQWGWHAGLFVRFKLLGIIVQPEAVFASNTFDYNVTAVAGDPATLVSQKFNRLSIPLLLGLKLGPIRIMAGPAASIQIGSPEDLINDPNFNELYKSAVWGFQAGLGIDLFKKLTIDARYAGGFGPQDGSTTISGQTFTFTNAPPSLLLSVGFMF